MKPLEHGAKVEGWVNVYLNKKNEADCGGKIYKTIDEAIKVAIGGCIGQAFIIMEVGK